MATTVNDFLVSKRETITSDDGSVHEIQLDSKGNTAWYLKGVHVQVTTGSATTYQVKMGETSTWTTGSIDEYYTGTATVAVGTKVWELQDPVIPFTTDADGKTYWAVNWDAGSDNDVDVVFWFQGARGR